MEVILCLQIWVEKPKVIVAGYFVGNTKRNSSHERIGYPPRRVAFVEPIVNNRDL